MHTVVSEDLAEDYYHILRSVRDQGDIVAPRGLETREVLGFHMILRDPTRALVRGTERKVHVALAAAEALQLIGGFSDPMAMLRVSEHFRQFMDGGVFHAPYGPRVSSQLPRAIDWLNRDPDTRKAYVAVWDPTKDLWTADTRDHPCTTHFQFMIRRGRLDMHVGMRANDAWRGFPYDVFQFTQLQQAVAACLGVEPGHYHHHATSFHLYEENLEAVDKLRSSSQAPILGVHREYAFTPWEGYRQRARDLFYGTMNGYDGEMNDGERLMHDALRRVGVEGAW